MKRFLIAASGTGGHLFPAVYIAQAITEKCPGAEIHFLGSGRPLEQSIFSKAGPFPIHTISIVGIKNLGVIGFFRFLIRLPKALVETWRLLSAVSPDCIIGAGGYVTVLPIVLGKLRGIPSWIHEAELAPGMANYALSFVTDKISVAFQETKMPIQSKVVRTGHPVRKGLEQVSLSRRKGITPNHLLVLGGSQGATALDDALPKLGSIMKEHDLSVRHQCRRDSAAEVKRRYDGAGVDAAVVSFIEDMHEAYAWADVIISRSGAGSVMEIGIINKPSILVPFPFAQSNHQLHNAKLLSDCGKAIICEEGEGFPERLGGALREILNPERYDRMAAAPNPNRATDAAERIAEGVLTLLNKRSFS